MSLITCGSIHWHEGHEWFTDYSRGRQEIFMCLAVLLCEQFCRFVNGGAKISIKSYFMRSFFLSVFSSGELLGKISSIRSKLSIAACWSREEKRGNCEANLLYVEINFGITDRQIFAPRLGVKFDRRVKLLAR